MAIRRMFAKSITDSDDFLDLPLDVQLLYFHLGMQADDEGFLNSTKKIVRMLGVEPDALQILCDMGFLIQFPSGVVAIRHWHVSNKLRKDRRMETQFQEERKQLVLKFDVYEYGKEDDNQVTTKCQPDDNQMATQGRRGEDRKGQDSGGEDRTEEASEVERSEGEKSEEKQSIAQPSGGEETRFVASQEGFSTNPQPSEVASVGEKEEKEFFDLSFQRKKEEALQRLRDYQFQPLDSEERLEESALV